MGNNLNKASQLRNDYMILTRKYDELQRTIMEGVWRVNKHEQQLQSIMKKLNIEPRKRSLSFPK